MKDFTKLFQGLEREIEEETDLLLSSIDHDVPTTYVYDIMDDMEIEDSGHSFLSDKRNKKLEDFQFRLLRQQVQSSKYVVGEKDGKPVWDDGKRLKFLYRCEDLLRKIMVLMYVSKFHPSLLLSNACVSFRHISTPPARAEELYTLTFRNGPNTPRTLFAVGSRFLSLLGYNKTTSSTNKLKEIPRFLTERFSRTLAKNLTFLRLVEETFVRDLFGEESYKVVHTHLFYRLTPTAACDLSGTDGLSSELRIQTEKYLGAALGVLDWRHLQTALCRVFLGDLIELGAEDQTNMFSAGFGHTGEVSTHKYGELLLLSVFWY